LVFLAPDNPGFSQHTLLPEMRKPLDYVSLIIRVGINGENINSTIQSIKKDSKEKSDFVNEIRHNIKHLDT